MAKPIRISAKELHGLFEYRDGDLIWREDRGRKTKSGDLAGSMKDGYVVIRINGKSYRAHRLIYLMHHGFLPDLLDHINRIKSDNRIENIREASVSENAMNRKPSGTSRYKGVAWHARDERWVAGIRIGGRQKHLGSFIKEDDAAKAYDCAAKEHHKEFANLNFPHSDTHTLVNTKTQTYCKDCNG